MTFSRRLTSMTLYLMMPTHEEESQGWRQPTAMISKNLFRLNQTYGNFYLSEVVCLTLRNPHPKSGVEGQE